MKKIPKLHHGDDVAASARRRVSNVLP